MLGQFEIAEQLVLVGGPCPCCGRLFHPNGLGPENSVVITRVLGLLPSTHLLTYGARWHDWAYHFGPNWGPRAEADLLFWLKNEEEIDRECHNFLTRWYYRRCNRRNYLAVREFGEASWNKDKCERAHKVSPGQA